MTKGSIWRKWDFHLHTPHSILNSKYGDPALDETWNTYISRVEDVSKEQAISAIGFTDYFTIEGYKKVKKYQQDEGRLSGIFAFPNIEFRASNVILDKREEKRLNFHVIFSPDISTNEIEEDFLHEIDFVYEEDAFETVNLKKLKIHNLEDLGRTLIGQHQRFKEMNKPPLFIGCMTAVVDPVSVKKILVSKPQFKGKYLFCLSEERMSCLSWDGQAHAVKKHLLQMSHCYFSSNENTRNFCLGKDSDASKFVSEFKSLKPCIWGCDSHGYNERFLVPDKNKKDKINFCWVKADLTWDGLKQILYEPEDRICIQEESPEPQKSIHTINSLTIKGTQVNDRLSIKDMKIDLNHNLVSIIGGRGSGKTAILDLIASCFKEGNKLDTVLQSFYYRLYHGETNNTPIETELGTKYNSKAILKEVGKDPHIIQETDILYITQNHFEGVSSDSSLLSSHVFKLVFEKFPDKLKELNNIKDAIKGKQSQIERLNVDIKQLFKEISQRPSLEDAKQNKIGTKTDCESRIKELQEQGKVDEAITTLTEELKEKREERIVIEGAKTRIDAIKSIILNLNTFNKTVSSFNLDFCQKLGLLLFELIDNQKIDTIENAVNKNEKLITDKLAIINRDIEAINEKLNAFEDTNKILSEFSTKLISTNEEIKRLETQLNDCEEKEEKLKKLEDTMFEISSNILNQHLNQNQLLTSHIKTFESDKSDLLEKIQFSVKSRLDSEKYYKNLAEVVNKRCITDSDLESNLKEQIVYPINEMLLKAYIDNDSLKQALIKVQEILKDKLKSRYTIFDLRKNLLDIPVNAEIELTFDGIPLEKLSMGQRAIVLLQIILAYDDKPLLIDQPEADLDNEYIYTQLVAAFRNAKKKRQIIIATHNANLAVNTDSEQVIVTDYKDGAISYSVGTIEDVATQEKIKIILEGGKEAFVKREEKYGYKF